MRCIDRIITGGRRRHGISLVDVLVWTLVVGIIVLAVWLSRRRVETGAAPTSAAPAATPPAVPSMPSGGTSAGATPPRGSPGTRPGTSSTAGGLPVMAVKPKPVDPGFQGCPPQGDGGDPELNTLKNRADSAAWIAVPFSAVEQLPWPKGAERRRRSQWSGEDAAAVARSEGLPIVVEGYLAGAKEEGPESPNCHGADHEFRDWHLWLADTPGRDRSRSIVVETTPVVRARHPEWTLPALRRLARDSARVRVSGWLMLDPEHPEQIGRTRGTIWEIHPIMKIEVERGGRWGEIGKT